MTMTVARRIGLLSLVALIGVTALAGLMWKQVDRVYDAANFANLNTVPSLRDLGAAYDAISALRGGVLVQLAQADDQSLGDAQQQAALFQKRAEEALLKYEKEDMDEPQALFVPDKANLDASRALLAEYVSLKDKLFALLHQNQRDEARALLGAEQALMAQLATSFAAHRKLNMDFAQAAAVDAAATRISALTLSTSVALLTLLAMAVIGYVTTRAIVRPLAAAVGAARGIAAGDLTVSLRTGGRDEIAQLLQALSDMRDKLSGIVHGVRGNAESVATASTQISQGNHDLSQRTEEQASSLQQTAATMDELGSTVRQNADNARHASQLALGASSVATEGGKVVGRVVQTMKSINDSSKKIADIISVIDGIAFQTNILALNAAVEAARAGEQGRGFAVVAGEVRSLAQRSAEAAKQIKGLITSSVEQVERGSELVDQAGKTMQEIVGSIQRVSDIVGEISVAGAQQSSGVNQVGQAITQMDQATQRNAALVEESAAAAEGLKGQALQLVQAVAVFKLAPGAGHPLLVAA